MPLEGQAKKVLDREGFLIIPKLLTPGEVAELVTAIETALTNSREDAAGGYRMRRLMEKVPEVRSLAMRPPTQDLVASLLGPAAFPVRSLFFDKTPEANWKVSWHQDLTIAVEKKLAVPGFGPWSMKDGVHHVQPPIEILQKMLTVRIHLDDCFEDNGPLQVLPGSHRGGRLGEEEIHHWKKKIAPVICEVPAGGALVMKPLLLHASSASKNPRHRRVIHLEFAAGSLPHGLQWSIG